MEKWKFHKEPDCDPNNEKALKLWGHENAMMQEVAELSGNFCGELSSQEEGEGILASSFVRKIYETHGSVCVQPV